MAYNNLERSDDDAAKTIFYALVARGPIVLAEATALDSGGNAIQGNFEVVVRDLLGRFAQEDGRKSYTMDHFMLNYSISEGITYLCLSGQEAKRRISFGFLAALGERFIEQFPEEANMIAQTDIADATRFTLKLDRRFSSSIQTMMAEWNDPTRLIAGDKLSAAQQRIQSVKTVMIENIGQLVERGEKLEVMVQRTDKMATSAMQYRRGARKVRRKMQWRSVMWSIVIVAVVVVIVIAVVAVAAVLICREVPGHCIPATAPAPAPSPTPPPSARR
jgi:vesicle-associated membrane protein 7